MGGNTERKDTRKRERMSDEHTTLGEMDGRWAVLLKFHLAIVPPLVAALLALTIWLVTQQFADIAFRESGERFSKSDSYEMDRRHREQRDLLRSAMDAKFEALNTRLGAIENQQARILAILERQE